MLRVREEQNRRRVGQEHRLLEWGRHKLTPEDNAVNAVRKGCPGSCGVSEEGLHM